MINAGPFQTLIFADSICSLATAAPLVYITKPWQFASWRLVVTLLSFQVSLLVSIDPRSLRVGAAEVPPWRASMHKSSALIR